MRRIALFSFFIAGLGLGPVFSLNLTESAADYGFTTFNACGPADNCVELPDVPYVWRFIPEYMGYRKFTPVGAIRKDWNDWWLSRKRGWWDWSNGIGEERVRYGIGQGYNQPYSLGNGGSEYNYNYRRSIGNPHPGFPNWQRSRYGNSDFDD